jgi:heme-degrading monooxygenase HmoA
MFIAVTRYEQDPARPSDPAYAAAIAALMQQTEGWLGTQVFRSTTDPRQMMRITIWESLDVRDRAHATAEGQRLALGSGPQREFYELVREDRPGA